MLIGIITHLIGLLTMVTMVTHVVNMPSYRVLRCNKLSLQDNLPCLYQSYSPRIQVVDPQGFLFQRSRMERLTGGELGQYSRTTKRVTALERQAGMSQE